jgi:hypothetical protein
MLSIRKHENPHLNTLTREPSSLFAEIERRVNAIYANVSLSASLLAQPGRS